MWGTRDKEAEAAHKLRISLEPDSPAKSRADAEFIPPPIEELTIPYLAGLPGTQLKKVVRVLCEEAKHLNVFAEQLLAMRQTLKDKIKERRALENTTETDTQAMKAVCQDKEQFMQQLLLKRKQLAAALNTDREQLRKEEIELDVVNAQLGDLQREAVFLKVQELRQSDSTDLLTNYRQAARDTRQKLQELETSVKESVQEMKRMQQKLEDENNRLGHETEKLQDESQELHSSLTGVLEKNGGLKQELAAVKRKVTSDSYSDRL